jgi:hypothetical protein
LDKSARRPTSLNSTASWVTVMNRCQLANIEAQRGPTVLVLTLVNMLAPALAVALTNHWLGWTVGQRSVAVHVAQSMVGWSVGQQSVAVQVAQPIVNVGVGQHHVAMTVAQHNVWLGYVWCNCANCSLAALAYC